MRTLATDFFVLRSPLLPYDDVVTWSSDLEAPRALGDPERLTAALAADRARLRTRLAEIVARPEVRDALYVASPDLDGSYDDWLAAPNSRRGRRVERALVRYLERMAARATPFGLFAGCAVGAVGEETRLTLPPRSAHQRHTRLDMYYLCGLIGALERDPQIRAQLRFRPSSSLYRLGEHWHWTELTPDDPRHSHRFRRCVAGPWIDRLVELARHGATLGELGLGRDGEAALPGLGERERLEELVEQQLLVSELQPAVTGPEPIHPLIERLDALAPGAPLAAEAAAALRAVRNDLRRLDEGGLGAAPDAYRAITRRLEALPGTVDRARLFQGELIKTPHEGEADSLVLGADLLAEVERGVEILHRLHHPARSSFARFRDAFVTRHEGVETRREVPLMEVLDSELGLGFGPTTGHDGGVPLIDGLELPSGSADQSVRWGLRQTFLLAKLSEALASGATEIELTEDDLDQLANPAPMPLPSALAVTAVAVASSPTALARGDLQVLILGVAGPSGARMLGRFCHGDPVLRERVERHLGAEEPPRPGAVLAEIAHLPEPRTGNILHRPLLREYEITYLGASGAPIERQIPVTDLIVTVEGERVVLRSQRLGCEVIPRLTSAQNYFHPRTTALYRFLAALQDQGIATKLGWDWGPLANAPFLPRVTSGRLVLARAQWRIAADETAHLGSLQGAALFEAIQVWRARRGIPRHARLADYDNELLVDFDNVLSVESFAQLVKDRDSARLVEAFPGPDDLCVSGPDGRSFHELSIPFLRAGASMMGDRPATSERSRAITGTVSAERPSQMSLAPAVGSAVAAVAPRPQIVSPLTMPRRSSPGSEWLFAKLYTGPALIDDLLRRVVRPLVDRALDTGAADSWFFIRYGDPEWHLRLRFRGDPGRLHGELLPRLNDAVAPLLERGQVRKLVLDTYERELERYGGPVGLRLCEQLFQADSTAVLEIVEALDDEELAENRWKLAAAGMDVVLEGLGLSLTEKLAVGAAVRDGFAREHRADQKLLRQIGERFRTERSGVEYVLDPSSRNEGPVAGAVGALDRLAERITPTIARLREASGHGRLTLSLAEIAPSLLHMHANRMLRSDQRRHELVLYDFLYRLYDARAARARESAIA
jgi:thiopeptide-type bacteriocin biosynthesis protein